LCASPLRTERTVARLDVMLPPRCWLARYGSIGGLLLNLAGE
jgi:hypothetical protein